MLAYFARPYRLATLLYCLTFIPMIAALPALYQIPTGQLPPSSIKFSVVPWSLFVHAFCGILFSVLGPLQFSGALKNRFGRLHRISGRVFVGAGLVLAFSSLRLLAQFPDAATWVLISARTLAAIAMALFLVLSIEAIKRRNIADHRAWMIRAYAIGMGAATISLFMFPIFLITGEIIKGYAADLLFVLSWVINIVTAEIIIKKLNGRKLAV